MQVLSSRSMTFQSTPVIADERMMFSLALREWKWLFQSTPVIADERMQLLSGAVAAAHKFQSTPVIADERMYLHQLADLADPDVSIHARHC